MAIPVDLFVASYQVWQYLILKRLVLWSMLVYETTSGQNYNYLRRRETIIMSWSSEYEPSTDDFASPGRTLSYQPDKDEGSNITSDTLNLSDHSHKQSGPSWVLIVATIFLSVLAAGLIASFFLF